VSFLHSVLADSSFLALAPTFMTKALNRVLELAIDDPASRPPSGAVQLIALSSNGDLRSAINSLQVLCSGDALRVKGGTAKKQRTAPARGRGSRGGRGARVVVSDEIRAA
jgi:cell cycle checkpoint protein